MKKDNQEQEKPFTKITIDELKVLAEQGHDFAQFNLALCYWDGEGVEKDFKQAIKWFKKAANQEHAWSQNNLGLCYEYGDVLMKILQKPYIGIWKHH